MNIKNRCVPCGKVEGWLERIIAIEEQGIALNNEVNNIWDSLGLQGTIGEYLMFEVDAIKSDYQAKIDQEVKTTSTPTFAGIITSGLVDGVDISAFKAEYDLIKSDYESLKSDYQAKINQEVKTTSTPTFAGIITPGLVDGVDISAFKAEYDLFSSSIQDIIIGQFNLDLLTINVDKNWNNKSITNINNIELNGLVDGVDLSAFKSDYDSKINQGVKTTDSPTFAGIVTPGLVDGVDLSSFKADYDSKINQGVKTTHSPTFAGITVSGNISISGLVDGVDLSSFKSDYDSKIDQAVKTTSSPSFNQLNLNSSTGMLQVPYIRFNKGGPVGICNTGGLINFYSDWAGTSYQGIFAENLRLNASSGQIRSNNDITLSSLDGSSWKAIKTKGYYIETTQIIDSSRNITNIESINSGQIISNKLPVFPYGIASSEHQYEDLTEESTTSTSYVCLKSVKLGIELRSVKVNFSAKTNSPLSQSKIKLCKNGTIIGTEIALPTAYSTYSQDLNNILPGDTIELYLKTDSGYQSYVKDFWLGYTLTTFSAAHTKIV